jgi:hypothetical protein
MFVVLHIVEDYQSKHACNTCVKPFLYVSMWTKILQMTHPKIMSHNLAKVAYMLDMKVGKNKRILVYSLSLGFSIV